MRCPKCQFDHELQTTECLKCGIVFSKYKPQAEVADIPALSAAMAKSPTAWLATTAGEGTAAAAVSSLAASLDGILSSEIDKSPAETRKEVVAEFTYRLLAPPIALLLAWWLTGTGFNTAAGMLAMVLHESGHAITAWLTGRWAMPMLWVTMHGEDRSWLVVVALTAAIAFGEFLAWRAKRWGWLSVAAALLIIQFVFLSPAVAPGAMIVFGGDGGALVLATILMAAFYAPRESAVYRSWGLRWGLLAIGALAFMHVFRSWSGPYENIPFGEIEGVNLSDPSLLTEMYGWSVIQLVDRYVHLAMVCLGALGAVYAWGLLSAYAEMSCMRRMAPKAPSK